MRANSPDVLIRLARSGAGVVAVAEFFAEPYLARGELQRVLPDWCLPDAECWAVFPGRRLMPAKTRVFIDMLSKMMSVCSEAVRRVGAGGQRVAGTLPRRLKRRCLLRAAQCGSRVSARCSARPGGAGSVLAAGAGGWMLQPLGSSCSTVLASSERIGMRVSAGMRPCATSAS